MIYPRQTSFVGGEIAPAFWGRTDVDRYAHSLKRCRNMLPIAQGAATSRPGTKYVAEVKDSSKVVRLIPFSYSEDQTFVIEFGDLYVRFYTQGGQVLATGSPAYAGGTTYAKDDYVTSVGITYRSLQAANVGHTPASSPTWWAVQSIYEITSPYAAADLARLKYSQSGDVIDLTRQGYQPRQLKRLSNISWLLALTPNAFADTTPPGYFGGWPTPAASVGTVDTAGDATHPTRWWYFVVSAIRSDGREAPSGTIQYGSPTQIAMWPDRSASRATLSWTPLAGATGYRIYRGLMSDGGLVATIGPAGLVGIAQAGTTTFVDVGNAPDYSQQSPLVTNPCPTANDYPAVSTYFEQRRVLANSVNGPGRVRASKAGDFGNFDGYVPPLASDALDITLASLKREEIRSLLPGRDLLAFTSSGIWSIAGSNGAPLSPTSLDAHRHSAIGSSWLDAIGIGYSALFVQDMGGIPRDIAFSRELGGYAGKDLAIFARHLFTGHSLVDWTYAREPYSVVWAVRDDGVLLALTYVHEQEVFAWSWHDTDGAFENVCAVAEGQEHALYAVVRRTVNGATKRYVERFATRIVPDVKLGIFLDAALSYDGRKTSAAGWVLSNLSATTPGSTGKVTSTTEVMGTAAIVGSEIWLGASGAAPTKARVTKFNTSYDVDVVLVTNALLTSSTDVGIAPPSLSGLDHLESKTVGVLADGNYGGAFPVASGKITLAAPALIAIVGLIYTPEFQLLDLAQQGSELRAQQKLVRRVAYEVNDSRGLSVGQDFNHLVPWKQRSVSDGYGPIQPGNTLVEINIDSAWSKSGGAVLRQTLPLPLTVVAAIREVELGSS